MTDALDTIQKQIDTAIPLNCQLRAGEEYVMRNVLGVCQAIVGYLNKQNHPAYIIDCPPVNNAPYTGCNHTLQPRVGAIAYCQKNYLGIITGPTRTPNGWTGIHLSLDKLGHTWTSVNPKVVGYIEDITRNL